MADLNAILRGEGTTLIAQNHLQQITGFTRGGGVEFLPLADQDGIRKAFLDGLARDNKLRAAINCMIVKLLKTGKILLYLRPIPGSYRIHWYPADQYQIDYNRYGEIDAATIVYGYKRRDESGTEKDRWVRIRLTAQVIQVTESDSKLSFAPAMAGEAPEIGPNRLGFVPCVEVLNPTPGSELDGVSDFNAIAQHLEAHDELSEAIIDAIIFYCQSPILTSRDANEISDSGLADGDRPANFSANWQGSDSVSHASGFRSAMPSPWGAKRSRRRLKRVIGGVDPSDDMFQQLGVSGVSGEAIQYASDYERQLREAMGGLLERGIETAAETRVVYGKVQSTARDKQVALFENGLCRLLEMAVLSEEALYVASGGLQGLPPMGDRRVNYRVSPIFLESTNETLQKSIVSRNLMRQGVNAKEALKFVFPDKSESELDIMVGSGGLPTEYLEAAMRIMSQLISLKTQDAITGLELPVADPATGEPLYRTLIPFITDSLDYGSQFRGTQPSLNSSDRARDRDAVAAAVRTVNGSNGVLPANNSAVAVDDSGRQLNTTDPSESIPDPNTVQRGSGFLDFRRSPILNGIRSAIGL
jgi:hypothetical protein